MYCFIAIIQIQVGFHCSSTNALINFWVRFFDMRRETILKSLSYHIMLMTPPTFGTSRGPISISQHHGRNSTSTVCLNSREPNCLFTWSKVNSQLPFFSKSSNSQDHHFQAWRPSHSSLISYLGFIMTIVIVISFVHEHKLYPMTVHLD